MTHITGPVPLASIKCRCLEGQSSSKSGGVGGGAAKRVISREDSGGKCDLVGERVGPLLCWHIRYQQFWE